MIVIYCDNECLGEIINYIVEQIFFFRFSVLTGYETNNRYKIFNSMGQQIMFAQEGKNHIKRQFRFTKILHF